MTEPWVYTADGLFCRGHFKGSQIIPAGHYNRLTAEFDLHMPSRGHKRNLAFYLGKADAMGLDPTRNLFAFIIVGRDGRVRLRHGPRVPGGWRARPKLDFSSIPFKSVRAGRFRLQYGREKVHLDIETAVGTSSVEGSAATALHFNGKQPLTAVWGFDGEAEHEPQAADWEWSNLRVEIA